MARRRRRNDGEVWIVVEVRAPRWSLWCIAAGMLLVGVAAVVHVWLAVR